MSPFLPLFLFPGELCSDHCDNFVLRHWREIPRVHADVNFPGGRDAQVAMRMPVQQPSSFIAQTILQVPWRIGVICRVREMTDQDGVPVDHDTQELLNGGEYFLVFPALSPGIDVPWPAVIVIARDQVLGTVHAAEQGESVFPDSHGCIPGQEHRIPGLDFPIPVGYDGFIVFFDAGEPSQAGHVGVTEMRIRRE